MIAKFVDWIDRGVARAALVIFTVLLVASLIITATSFSLPKPVDSLEAWFKLFQSVVAVVVGLKIAWNIDPLIRALATRIAAPGGKG